MEVAEAQEEDVDRAVKAARKVCTLLMPLYCSPMLKPCFAHFQRCKLLSCTDLRVHMGSLCEAPGAQMYPGAAGV